MKKTWLSFIFIFLITVSVASAQSEIVIDQASEIEITDAGNYYDTDDVESALQDIASGNQEVPLVILAKVNEGGGITKGEAVYISGASGEKPQVSLADNTAHDSSHTLGISMETKADTQNMRVIMSGELIGVDTSGFTAEGDRMHLASAGAMQSAVLTSGAHIHMGFVSKKDASDGIMIVAPEIYVHDVRGVDDQQVQLNTGDDDSTGFIYFKNYSNATLGYVRGDGLFYWGSDFTLNTGSDFTLGSDVWNSGDLINGIKVADADLGDVSVSSGVWSVDSGAVLLNEIGDPSGDTAFTMGNNNLVFNYGGNDADHNLEVNLTGANDGDGIHVHQHTGNPGGGTLLTAESVDVDKTPQVRIHQDKADVDGPVVQLLISAVDDDDSSLTPIEVRDDVDVANDLLFRVGFDGLVSTDVGIDAIGATDFDIGSADVLDVTIIEDGGIYTFDNGFKALGEDLGSTAAEWNDLFLNDGGIIQLGNDQDVTITHVADTGILINLGLEVDGTLNADGAVALGDGGDNFSVASDGIDIDTSGNITNGTIEGTAVISTGEGGGTKFLREDGDGTSSWQTVSGGGGFAWQLSPPSPKLPASNPVGIDAGNLQWRGLFDDTTDECGRWQGVLTPYGGGGLDIDITYTLETTSSSDIVELEVYVMCGKSDADIDIDSFDIVNNLSSGSVSITAGYEAKLSATLSNDDSCVEDSTIIIKICRDADDTDTTADDVEFRGGSVHE